MRTASLLLVSVGLVLASPWPARACDCTKSIPDILLPRDGAAGVPTNARVLVSAERAGMPRWAGADATAALPDLQIAPWKAGKKCGKPGRPVKVTVATMMSEAYGTVYVVRPEQPLAAGTTWALVRATGKKPADRKVISTFTTGAAADTAAPFFAGLEGFTAIVDFRRKLSDCDGEPPFEQLTWKYGEARDDSTAAADLLRILYVHRKGEPRAIRIIEPAEWPGVVGRVSDGACDPFHVVMKPNDRICAVVEVVDLAGNAAGGAMEKCMQARGM